MQSITLVDMFSEERKMRAVKWEVTEGDLWYLLKAILILSLRSWSESEAIREYIRESVFLPTDLHNSHLYSEELNPTLLLAGSLKPSSVVTSMPPALHLLGRLSGQLLWGEEALCARPTVSCLTHCGSTAFKSFLVICLCFKLPQYMHQENRQLPFRFLVLLAEI